MNRNWKGLYSYGAVGLELNVSVLIGFFGGRWLDRKLGTGPWLTLGLIGVGVAVGFYGLYRVGVQANRDAEREAVDEREQRNRYHDDSDPGDDQL